jgi:hypothetical protein
LSLKRNSFNPQRWLRGLAGSQRFRVRRSEEFGSKFDFRYNSGCTKVCSSWAEANSVRGDRVLFDFKWNLIGTITITKTQTHHQDPKEMMTSDKFCRDGL